MGPGHVGTVPSGWRRRRGCLSAGTRRCPPVDSSAITAAQRLPYIWDQGAHKFAAMHVLLPCALGTPAGLVYSYE